MEGLSKKQRLGAVAVAAGVGAAFQVGLRHVSDNETIQKFPWAPGALAVGGGFFLSGKKPMLGVALAGAGGMSLGNFIYDRFIDDQPAPAEDSGFVFGYAPDAGYPFGYTPDAGMLLQSAPAPDAGCVSCQCPDAAAVYDDTAVRRAALSSLLSRRF